MRARITLLLLVAARAAGAQEPTAGRVDPSPPAAPREAGTSAVPLAPTPSAAPQGPRWYGWQTLLLDALTGGAAVYGYVMLSFESNPPAIRHLLTLPHGAAGYLLHRAHGRPVYAVFSGLVRAALPPLFALNSANDAARTVRNDPSWWATGRYEIERSGYIQSGLFYGYLISMLSITAIDSALSWEGLPVRTTSLVPHLTLTRSDALAGVSGQF